MNKQSSQGENSREIGKSKNRAHLINSAADAIFQFGFRGTTIANIQEVSGLSRGMINLHFKSKENLLLAVAEYLAEHYAACWQKAIHGPGDSPADKLRKIFAVDLGPEVLNPRDVAIWFAFRSEVVSHPEYRSYIDSRGSGVRDVLLEICTELAAQSDDPESNPVLAANALVALLEGMWTDYHLHSDRFDRDKAVQACLYVARNLFPGHF